MHKYLRAVGFSNVKTKRQLNELISYGVQKAKERSYTTLYDDTMLAEYNLYCGERMGLCIRGEYDENNQFFMDYAVPFLHGAQISSYADISVERHSEKESYAGVCDDLKVGISIIFYLQNIVAYLKRKNADLLPSFGTSLTLAGLSVDGKIIMPLYKNEAEKSRSKQQAKRRMAMIAKARQGDEEAMEHLAMEDMDTYTNVSRLLIKQDVLSLVDTYFMPYGVECDQYAILGEILQAKKVENILTKEAVWQLTLSCNDMIFDICINAEDLFGEPAVGRRFKGSIWLQGKIHYADV